MMESFMQALALAPGALLPAALLAFIYKRDAIDWEKLAAVYARPWETPQSRKRFANMILYSEGRPAKGYKGVIGIGLHEDGIALRPNPFLKPFQEPVFIPYAEIRGWDQPWYLDAKSTELSFSKAPQMRMIMPREQVEWMLSLDADGAARISDARPPHGTRPWLTSAAALVLGAAALVVIVVLLVKGLPT